MHKLISAVLLAAFTLMLFTQDIVLSQVRRTNKYSLAVINFSVDGKILVHSDSKYFTQEFIHDLQQSGYFFTMTQSKMEDTLYANRIDPFRCFTPQCGFDAGRALGVQLVAIGKIDFVDGRFAVDVLLLHVASKRIVKSVHETFVADNQVLSEGMRVVANELLGIPKAKSVPEKKSSERSFELVPAENADSTNTAKASSFKWQYVGFGLLVAGGIGAGVLLLQNGSGRSVTTASDLPGPPAFP